MFARRFTAAGMPHGGEIIVVRAGAGQGVDFGILAQACARPGNPHRFGFEPDAAACVP